MQKLFKVMDFLQVYMAEGDMGQVMYATRQLCINHIKILVCCSISKLTNIYIVNSKGVGLQITGSGDRAVYNCDRKHY